MAKFVVTSLNYASSGQRRGLINMDICFDYSYTNMQALADEGVLSGIASESALSCVKVEKKYKKVADIDQILRNKTFMADKDSIDGQGTKNYDKNLLTASDHTVRPMYDIKDVCIKSPIKKTFSKNYVLPNTDEYIDIYQPDITQDPIAFCNYNDRSIVLADNLSNDFVFIKTSLRNTARNFISFYYTTYLDNKQKNEIYTYTPAVELCGNVSSYQQYLNLFSGDFTSYTVYNNYVSAIYRVFSPKYSHIGVDCDYIVNLEQTELPIKYDDGNIYGLAAKAKNMLDQLYSQNMLSNQQLFLCRSYQGIMETGNQVYLKFTNNVSYDISYTMSSDNVISVKHSKTADLTSVPYQKIEQFTPTQIGSTTRHKSNLFSINVSNTSLESATYGYMANIQKDIVNAVYDIVSQISPANTQLYDVQFTN